MSLEDTFLATPPWKAFSYLTVVSIFVVLTFAKCRSLVHEHDVCFGDARVYARAIHRLQAGADPYSTEGVALPFVYPPLFLKVAAFSTFFFPKHLGWIVYLGAASFGILSIPWLITAGYTQSEWLTAPIAMALFTIQPRLVEELMLLSGNIANPLYALALVAGLPGIRHNRWTAFYIAVTLAALVKPPFLALLILPLLAGSQQSWKCLVPVVLVFTGYWTQGLLMPQAFMDFKRAAYQQIVVQQDVGYGIYNYIVKLAHGLPFMGGIAGPTAAHVMIMAALIAPLVLLRRYRHCPAIAPLWVPVLLVIAILANPRMQRYDSDVAIIPALYICIECLKGFSSPLRTANVALTLTLFAAIYSKPEMGMFLVLMTSILLTIDRLRREHFHGLSSKRLVKQAA